MVLQFEDNCLSKVLTAFATVAAATEIIKIGIISIISELAKPYFV